MASKILPYLNLRVTSPNKFLSPNSILEEQYSNEFGLYLWSQISDCQKRSLFLYRVSSAEEVESMEHLFKKKYCLLDTMGHIKKNH